MRNSTWRASILILILTAASFPVAADTSYADAEKEVVAAGKTLDTFTADPDMAWFRKHAREAKGLVICSQIVKAGFIFGGSGGRCVFVAKQGKTWNGPAFYTAGTASAGFQAGIQNSAIIALVMTQKAIDSLMSSEFKVGGDASAAAGPVGIGTGGTPESRHRLLQPVEGTLRRGQHFRRRDQAERGLQQGVLRQRRVPDGHHRARIGPHSRGHARADDEGRKALRGEVSRRAGRTNPEEPRKPAEIV